MDGSPPGSCPWGFCRQEYWSGLPCSPPGNLRDPGIEPELITSSALAGWLSITSTTDMKGHANSLGLPAQNYHFHVPALESIAYTGTKINIGQHDFQTNCFISKILTRLI